jgi:hypothetical protein
LLRTIAAECNLRQANPRLCSAGPRRERLEQFERALIRSFGGYPKALLKL